MDRIQVTSHLKPKRIAAPDYEYEFQRSWKNEVWHVCEPVSFDLVDPGSLLDKANRWVGRATSLRDSPEPFLLHILLGEPTDERLKPTFGKAQNILQKIPGAKELIRESQAESFRGSGRPRPPASLRARARRVVTTRGCFSLTQRLTSWRPPRPLSEATFTVPTKRTYFSASRNQRHGRNRPCLPGRKIERPRGRERSIYPINGCWPKQ